MCRRRHRTTLVSVQFEGLGSHLGPFVAANVLRGHSPTCGRMDCTLMSFQNLRNGCNTLFPQVNNGYQYVGMGNNQHCPRTYGNFGNCSLSSNHDNVGNVCGGGNARFGTNERYNQMS